MPNSWGQSIIHSSLLIVLLALALMILVFSSSNKELNQFKPYVLTLPSIWVISLAVRIAAQHVAIGTHSLEFETVLGPTGNLSTNYEDLPPHRILKYALTGHFATFLLALVGAMICAVVIPLGSPGSWAKLWDVPGGWSNHALAAQVMWVNVFLGVLNLLPTVPFDNRALLYALFSRKRRAEEPTILHRLAILDSHLAAILMGSGFTLMIVNRFAGDDNIFCVLLLCAAGYLMIASRWESQRSRRLEEQYMPCITLRQDNRHSPSSATPHLQYDSTKPLVEANSKTALAIRPVNENELDNILRKLHREGASSLSIQEQEALLSASQRLKEKRSSGQSR